MPAQPHPIFEAPVDPEVAIWRYMDITKFASLVSTGSLYFCRADRLGDKFEGSVSYRTRQIERERDKQSADMLQLLRLQFRMHTYISCWHMNQHESAAMWSLYGKADGAVAVKSTYNRLSRCLPDNSHVGVVKYFDYDESAIRGDNSMAPFLRKMASFQHEQEVRAVIQEIPRAEGGGLDSSAESEPGLEIQVDLRQLISTIYVSPAIDGWKRSLIEEICGKYELGCPIVRSRLDEDPIF